ncbi:MAG: class II fructose-bisphosphate aldolase [Thermoleophilia bacterium]|nr:class II fructose-bisphosphate aldolase [Thermoleophilia bacterium]
MPLAPLTTLLADARAGGYAVGYFEAWDSYSLEAVVEAAEAESAPVILGFGCLLVDRAWLDGGGIEALSRLGRPVAEQAQVPTCLLLNEANTLEQARRGLDAGFTALMLHTGRQSLTDAVEQVGALVRAAHERGVAVEGELGSLPAATGSEIDDAHAALTDPGEAAAFVAATGVDSLAVSFGNVHVLEGRSAPVDLDRLAEIHRLVDVPLVVHGGTSFPPEAVAGAIARGVAKFNVGTVLKRTFLEGLAEAVGTRVDDPGPHELLGSHSSHDLLDAGKRRLVPVVRNLIRLYGGSGRAA